MLPEFCGGQRERIPDQLKFSTTIDATPVRWLPPILWVAYFTADSDLPFDQPTHGNWRVKSRDVVYDVVV
jgi:hypothetical protein